MNLICLLHCHFLSWVAHHNQQTPNSLKDLMSSLVSQIKRTSIRDKANNEILWFDFMIVPPKKWFLSLLGFLGCVATIACFCCTKEATLILHFAVLQYPVKITSTRLKTYSAQHLKDDGLHVKTCGISSYGIKFQKSQTTWLWRGGFSRHQSSLRMSLPLQFILQKSLQVVRFSSNLVLDFISSACHTLFRFAQVARKYKRIW
jgi:hypothetical protein